MLARRAVLLGLIAPLIGFAQLPVSVTDKAGNPVMDLPQSVFHIFVDGVEQPIGSFRPNQVPISMGLVVDNGASMRDQRQPMLTALGSTMASSDLLGEMFILG
jgi:Ca-activated chloride channel family protein